MLDLKNLLPRALEARYLRAFYPKQYLVLLPNNKTTRLIRSAQFTVANPPALPTPPTAFVVPEDPAQVSSTPVLATQPDRAGIALQARRALTSLATVRNYGARRKPDRAFLALPALRALDALVTLQTQPPSKHKKQPAQHQPPTHQPEKPQQPNPSRRAHCSSSHRRRRHR